MIAALTACGGGSLSMDSTDEGKTYAVTADKAAEGATVAVGIEVAAGEKFVITPALDSGEISFQLGIMENADDIDTIPEVDGLDLAADLAFSGTEEVEVNAEPGYYVMSLKALSKTSGTATIALVNDGSASAAGDDDGFDITSGLKLTKNEETGAATLETDYFTLTLSNADTWTYEADGTKSITIYSNKSRDNFGGRLMSVVAFDPDDVSYEPTPYKVIGEVSGKKIVATYASDVQYDPENEAAKNEYLTVFEETQTIQEGGKEGPLLLK